MTIGHGPAAKTAPLRTSGRLSVERDMVDLTWAIASRMEQGGWHGGWHSCNGEDGGHQRYKRGSSTEG